MSSTRTDNVRRGFTRFEEIKRNKSMYDGGLNKYDIFKERMLNPTSPDMIGERYFSPSDDFSIIIDKRTDVAPTNFPIISKNKENAKFLKEKLWEKSKIESKLPSSYKEQDLSGDSFWLVKTIVAAKNEKHMYNFDITQLSSEHVEPVVNPYTGELKAIRVSEIKEVVDEKGNKHRYDVKKTYTEEYIETEYINSDAGFISKMFGTNKQEKKVKNPFYGTGFLGVLWFKGEERRDSYTSYCPATRLIEAQLQLDKNWTQHEMAIHRGIFPITEFKKANRGKYDDVYLGAGAVIASYGEQELKIHAPQLMIDSMLKHISFKEQKIYFLGGVLPPSVEEKIYSTDSLGIAKFASKQLISIIETRLQSYKDEIGKLFRAFLELNGKKYEEETIKLPDEIIKVDLEKMASIYGILMSLGIIDDEYVWTELFPDLNDEAKARIKLSFKEKFGTMDTNNINLDNKLKPAGNKAKNTKNLEGKVVSDK